MSRDPYRSSAGDVSRREYDRVLYERDRDRRGDERIRYEDDDIAYTTSRRPPPTRVRDRSPDSGYGRGGGRTFEDERVVRDVVRDVVRERRYDDDDDSLIVPTSARRRPPPVIDEDFDRRVTVEREKTLVRDRSPPPGPRPGRLIRRQSSLDTFDRRPARRAYDYEHLEESYDRAPVRREDIRPPPPVPHAPIPLPRRRRRDSSVDRERDITTEFDEIRIEPGRYEGPPIDDFRGYPPEHERERIHETKVVETRRKESRSRSPASSRPRGRRARSPSVSSSSSSSSRSSGGATLKSARNEYPKKGKTRMPARLVSERALIDLGYPFIKEGNTIVVQVALGQDNIDDVLKLSQDYKKSETEVIESKTTKIKTSGGEVVEEERRREEIFMSPAVPPAPAPAPPAQVIVPAPPPPMPPAAEYTTTVKVRDVSPARSYTTTTSASTALTRARSRPRSRPPAVIVDAGPRFEVSEEVPVGPLALVPVETKHRHRRSRSHSHGDGALYAHIHDRHHGDRYYYDRQVIRPERERELITAERLSTGELVLYEEEVEKIQEPRHGLRIEKDKKGRMSISVPKYR